MSIFTLIRDHFPEVSQLVQETFSTGSGAIRNCVVPLSHAGKGVMIWKSKGLLYNGDWQEDKRHGYGLLSKGGEKTGYMKVYAGGWKYDKRHVSYLGSLYQFTVDNTTHGPSKANTSLCII